MNTTNPPVPSSGKTAERKGTEGFSLLYEIHPINCKYHKQWKGPSPERHNLYPRRSLKWKSPTHTGWIKKALQHHRESVPSGWTHPRCGRFRYRWDEHVTHNEFWRMTSITCCSQFCHVPSTCLEERREGFHGRKADGPWAKILSGKKGYSRQFPLFLRPRPLSELDKSCEPSL